MKNKARIALLSIVSLFCLSSCDSGLLFLIISHNHSSATTVSYIEYEPTYFEFGRYPQSEVTSEELLEVLEDAADSDGNGYVEHDGEEYAKITTAAEDESGTELTHYFKVEPIVWQIFKDGTLISDKILDICKYYTGTPYRTIGDEKIYVNNYKYSTVRAFLNGYDGSSYGTTNYEGKGFLDMAFSDEERETILTEVVKNGAATTESEENKYACEDTEDKIYLLSYQETFESEYGLGASYLPSNRTRRLTDYSYLRSSISNAYDSGDYIWLTRSPDYYCWNEVAYVNRDGRLYQRTASEISGVVPALKRKTV